MSRYNYIIITFTAA